MQLERDRPTHFTAYRLFAWPNFVRKRRVFTEPPCSFRSLSAAWLGQTLLEREEYFAWFSKTIEKIPPWNLLNKGDYKTFIFFFFIFKIKS
jgi:hypothetical protein